MNKLSTALSLALISTTSNAVQLTWAGDAANSDCACAKVASDPCCNQGGNNVDIALDFNVDVKRSAATVVAAAAAAPEQETATDNNDNENEDNNTPDEDENNNPAPVNPVVDPDLLTTGPISLGNDTPIGNGLVWSIVRGSALSDPAAFRQSDIYTGATVRDRAIMDALIAASNASGIIPSGTSLDISYTTAGGISSSTLEAAMAVASSSSQAVEYDESFFSYSEILGTDSTLPLGPFIDDGSNTYESRTWSEIVADGFYTVNSDGYVTGFKDYDAYASMSNY